MPEDIERKAMCATIQEHAKAYLDRPIDPEILAVMMQLDRQDFSGTHADGPQPIGHGQTISQPFMVAMMTDMVLQAAHKRDDICEIGTGSGYQAAILQHFFTKVESIERIEPLATAAKERLARMGYDRVGVSVGDGQMIARDSFDVLMATCGVTGPLPDAWSECLREKGVMLLPYSRNQQDDMRLCVWQKVSGKLREIRPLKAPLYCRFVPYVT